MTDLELDMFHKLFNELSWLPDKIIYIRTDPEVSMTRMKNRARDCETGVSFDYIKEVHTIHEELMARPDVAPLVIVIDGNQDADLVYKQVIQYI